MNRVRRKNIVFALAVVLTAVFAVCFFRVSTVRDYYNAESPLWESGDWALLTVDCTAALENADKLDEGLKNGDFLPKDGYMIAPVRVALEEGDTAYSLLIKAAKYYKLPLDIQGAGENSFGSAYIRGIGHLYEFSAGELSGWMYSVNDEFCAEGCDRVELKNEDEVRFVYTCSLGKDMEGAERK